MTDHRIEDREIEDVLNQRFRSEINPWGLAFLLCGWIWAAIWFVRWVMA